MLGWLRRSARQVQRRHRRDYNVGCSQGPSEGDKVVIAMSGGVDSSVAAMLLANKGYDLSAVFMRNWDARDESGTAEGCQWERDWQDVQRVCRVLDVPCRLVDLHREYWTQVFEPALNSWEAGVTPNPDVWCNRQVKFGTLLRRLSQDSKSGSDSSRVWLATGHYARKDWHSDDSMCMPRPRLLRAHDPTKDQSYYLSSITERALTRALFPLGGLCKTDVRMLATKAGLHTAAKGESMGICFVGKRNKFGNFLSQYIPSKPGPIIDMTTSKQIATHDGLWHYTIGQGARIRGCAAPMFVARKDARENAVFVVPGPSHPALYVDRLTVPDFDWTWADSPPEESLLPYGLRAQIKYRHCMSSEGCTVYRDERGLRVLLDEPRKGIAPGQVVALYLGDWCLGCGVISSAKRLQDMLARLCL